MKEVVHVRPKHLDEEVARLHLDTFGVTRAKLTPGQPEDLDLP